MLAEKLIDKVLLYINKTFKRTLKKRTNQSSPLQGEIEGVGNSKDTKLYIMEPRSRLP